MRSHNRNYSAARTRERLARGRSRQQPQGLGFAGQLLGGCALVAIVGWNIAPQAQALWTRSTTSPEKIAQIETSVYYSGCNEVRAAGAAPLYRGEPGYRQGMDGDGDGVACEPWRGY
ncbi:excalibur calcium-binding domain-containing protein [Sphingosinicella rhizophila]|uniref:Excalibur calcium-binding domain-containing protein n=1 Tax=Sphingosinicella rhizophila TaxID=3050082 RepID=A0ABU3Q542_9SPHN|nr:excalibur calcium-binding domain-containing protein [Sphingosinicella sp. GR2756]MDT9598535.1 excalibur calcium-binding domain-containing protein [Sphingosinicella sp. GR2756]